ncbi:MAG: multifunctional CCA addition/repair protein [Betaproteobacteria bacterium]|nr:multifunctional CCA addition/repair protein [Betaproteobacteria bacterium]
MQTYLVGGAVRDALMGLPVQDRDWVVVGSNPQAMLDAGYKPVGRDFPVFLHPLTREEYALARTERKTAPGYRGFVVQADPSVTLEQDLGRRDLTINAMAVAAAHIRPDGSFDPAYVVDPFGGMADLRTATLRHCTEAFREDPVRILRLARFAARFADFQTAPATAALMQAMVSAGEAAALVPERVWSELATGLMEAHPGRMLDVLRACGALRVLLPEVDALWGVPQSAEHHPEIDTGVHLMMVLQQAAVAAAPLEVRWACLMHDLGKATTPAALLPRHIGHEGRSVQLARQIGQRLRVPVACTELAEVVAREHGHIHRSDALGAGALLRLLERRHSLCCDRCGRSTGYGGWRKRPGHRTGGCKRAGTGA